MPALAPPERSRLPLEHDKRRRLVVGLDARQIVPAGGMTLDERISGTWATLVESGTADCPVCESPLRAGRECKECGAELN